MGSSPAALANEVVDRIVAIVGEDIVLQSEVDEFTKMQKGRFGKKTNLTRTEVLEELIKDRLLRQEIKRREIEVTPEDVKRAIGGILAQNQMTLDQLKAELARKGMSYEQYRNELEGHIRNMKFMSQVIYPRIDVGADDYEVYRRRNPAKAKNQSEEEIRRAIMEKKSEEILNQYVQGLRARTYVEIKNLT